MTEEQYQTSIAYTIPVGLNHHQQTLWLLEKVIEDGINYNGNSNDQILNMLAYLRKRYDDNQH